MTKDEVIELMVKAKELGMTEVTIDGVRFALPPVQVCKPEPQEMSEKDIEALVKTLNPFSDMTEDEIMYYATPYYDELQERKKKLQEAKQMHEEVANG